MLRKGRKSKFMKHLLIIWLLSICLSLSAQQITYEQWKEKAKTEINLRPEYGKVKKDAGYLKEDQTFIETVLKEDSTHRKGSEHMVKLGFNYLYHGDSETAMKRFNQAWLLDPKNENAYWGFGAIYYMFNDSEEALKQLDIGLAINPNSSNILTDKATIFLNLYHNNQNIDYQKKALEMFNRSYQINPLNQNTLFKLSAVYYYNNDCPNAKRFYKECLKLGGTPIPPGYADALNKQCPDK